MPSKKPAAKTAKSKKPVARKAPAPKSAAKPRHAPARAAEKSVKKATKPAAKPAAKPVAKPAAKPAAKALQKPASKPVARPVAKPAAKPVAKAPAKPAVKPVAKAAAKPAAKAAAKPAAKPVAAKAAAAATPAAAAKVKAAAPPPAPPKPRATGPIAIAVPSSEPRRYLPAPAEEDDGSEFSRHNLLLGPKNVKPYVLKKGEQYMNKEQVEHFRSILLVWKRDLMEEVDRTMVHMKDEAANPPDPNDRATLESEFALELRTRDRERKLIRKIDEALKRVEDGTYGYCTETGEPIGVKRLEARPVATLCIEAQERRERREKQYGDRDDWYR